MAYDEELANRLRELIGPIAGVREQRMFGGLGFLVGGNLAISVSGRGGLLVRVNPADSDRLTASGAAQVAVMAGRSMPGWLRVAPDQLRTSRALASWVRRGIGYASSLPPKP